MNKQDRQGFKKIKLIIFDLSGVCSSNEEPIYLEIFVKRHRLPHDRFIKDYMALLFSAEKGRKLGKDLWKSLIKKYDLPGTPKSIIEEMMSLKKTCLPTLRLAKSLRRRYKVAFLTNYCEDYWKLVKKNTRIHTYFDFGLVSYMIGYRKPAKQGFLWMLKKARARPQETVYIDDSVSNVAQARSLGLNGIHFTDIKSLKHELRKIY